MFFFLCSVVRTTIARNENESNQGRNIFQKWPYLTPNVAWSNVPIPDTKKIVATNVPRAGWSSGMHNFGATMNGYDTVPPIIVR